MAGERLAAQGFLSEPRATTGLATPVAALGQARSTQRHTPRVREDESRLVVRIVELAREYGRYGYRRITALLRREGWRVNTKRVERIWRQEGLKVPKRRKQWDGLILTLRFGVYAPDLGGLQPRVRRPGGGDPRRGGRERGSFAVI